MKRIVIALLSGILFLSACDGPAPAANTPVMSNTADVPASTPTVAPMEVVIPIPKVVLSNNLTGATDDMGVTPISINDLDLSVVGRDRRKPGGSREKLNIGAIRLSRYEITKLHLGAKLS